MGWVGLSLGPNFSFCNGLGWVQLKIDVFYLYVTGLFITYFLTVIPNKRNHIHLLKMEQYLTKMCICHGLINNFRNTMLLWLSDTLGTAAHTGDKCKKLQFIHTVNGDGSKTAKIIKRQC